MGTVYNNALSGNTNGTIVTVDYTADFNTLSGHLSNINTVLGNINTTLGTLNTTLGAVGSSIELSVGAIGKIEPGSVAYSSDAAVGWLAGIADTLAKMWDQQGKVASAVGQVQLALSGISSAANESVAVQQLALSDQISTNEFQKTATKDALARNGIDPPQPRPIAEVIKEKIGEATTINATAEAAAFVDEKLSQGVTKAANYGADLFTSSAAGQYLSRKWTAFTDYLNEPTAITDKAKLEAEKVKAEALAAKRAKI